MHEESDTLWRWTCGIFTLALIYAVFSFGSPVDPWRTRSAYLIGFASIALLLSLRVWRGLRFGWRVFLPALAWLWLFAYAIFMLWNAKAEHALHDPAFTWLTPPFPKAPGTMSAQASRGAPLEIGVLALVFAAAWLAARRGVQWLTLVKILVGTGVAVALFGILHKVTGATAVWWLEDRDHPVTFFAPYVYHASAGAFMNLVFPLAVAGAIAAPVDEEKSGTRWVWMASAGLLAGAVLITTSKGAILLIFVGMLLQLIAHRRRLRFLITQSQHQATGLRVEQYIMLAAVAIGACLILLIGWQNSMDRFVSFYDRIGDEGVAGDGRVKIAQVLANMAAPDAGGLWGYGPGTFPHLVPYFTKDLGDELRGVWLTGHNDWLQMFVEWGWIGGIAWIVIGPCSLIAGMLALKHRQRFSGREGPMIRGTLIGLIVTGLHGSFDFPFQIFSITIVGIAMSGFLWGKCAPSRPSGSGKFSAVLLHSKATGPTKAARP